MVTHKKHHHVVKKHTARLTPKSDTKPVPVKADPSRLPEIRKLVIANNRSNVDTDLIICQIYAESKFDPHAENDGAKGLMQMRLPATQQVFEDRMQETLKKRGLSKEEQNDADAKGRTFFNGSELFDDVTNIQFGTEYLKCCVNKTSTLAAAFAKYRGIYNGIFYSKISECASKLKSAPNSIQVLKDVFDKK